MVQPTEYLRELGRALDEYRAQDVRALTNSVDPAALSLTQIKTALRLLRRKRLFAELEHAAALFVYAGHEDAVIRRQWAQALLDQSRVDQALTGLLYLIREHAEHPVEGQEIRGLIGRAYKQRYVDGGGPDDLRQAIATYHDGWSRRVGDYRWHGINLVALVVRARRDGVEPGVASEPVGVAREILDDIGAVEAGNVWDYATAVEASVALADEEAAFAWTRKYTDHPEADAFELNSTLRQLKEVWCLHLQEQPIGTRLLPVLEYALARRAGASIDPLPIHRVKDSSGFEAVWGAEGLTYLTWLDSLYERCRSIARLSDARGGSPRGSGFLTRAKSIDPRWGDDLVLVTNAHVVSDCPSDQAPLRPGQTVAEFTRLPERPKVRPGSLRYYSPRIELDVSVLAIDPPVGAPVLEPHPIPPDLENTGATRIYVIGHPGGRDLAVSLYDNSLAEYEEQYVRYRSPTEEGQSGAPVLDPELNAFAIHHRALYERQLNEGILLSRILEDARQRA